MKSKIYQAFSSGSSNKIPDILLSHATSIIWPEKAEELFQPAKSAANRPQTCLNSPLAQPISDKHRQGCI